MSVVSTKELAQTFEREVGRPAIIKRRFVCILGDGTLQNDPATELEILAAVFNTTTSAIATSPIFGEPHPRLAAWKLRKFFITEGYENSPYHVEVVLEYGVVRDEEILHPTLRPSIWSVESAPGEVPALFYYDGTTQRPLTNSAFDYFPGLTVEESMVRITIKRNFATFPTAWVAAQNHVNSDFYFGMPIHTGKVANVSASYAYEEFGGVMVRYWDTTAVISYRQSGHNLMLPDVGFNFIGSQGKQRAMVFDFNNSEWVPSANPIGLNGSGGPSPTGNPAVLARRVNPETNFFNLFGSGPL